MIIPLKISLLGRDDIEKKMFEFEFIFFYTLQNLEKSEKKLKKNFFLRSKIR